jgi:hypothetical protein
MPDNVVILPNGGGILTPARIWLFGYDLTTILKAASFLCFAMCVCLLSVEVYYCFAATPEDDGSQNGTPGIDGSPGSGGGDTPVEAEAAAAEAVAVGSAEEGKGYGASDTK